MAANLEIEMPAGSAWAVGVSGGADSVGLLLLLAQKPGLQLHVAHLDHELRGKESAADAEFARELSARLGFSFHLARRSEMEAGIDPLPANRSARYRQARLAWFGKVVKENNLCGVVLAHHADDVAETVLQRLIRGSGPWGLTGIAADTRVGELRIVRPLLGIHRAVLRGYLEGQGQAWREDASNEKSEYLRNRLRKLLIGRRELTASLLELATACRALKAWAQANAPALEARFAAAELAGLPPLLGRAAARTWLIHAGTPAGELTAAVEDRLIEMAGDAASPAMRQFPGGVSVRRRGGRIWHNR